MTTGERTTDIPTSTNQRRRFLPQFTLRNLMFATFAVGFFLMLFREVAEYRRELKTAERYDPIPLEVTDPSKIHVRFTGAYLVEGFAFRVYLPPESHYELCAKTIVFSNEKPQVSPKSRPERSHLPKIDKRDYQLACYSAFREPSHLYLDFEPDVVVSLSARDSTHRPRELRFQGITDFNKKQLTLYSKAWNPEYAGLLRQQVSFSPESISIGLQEQLHITEMKSLPYSNAMHTENYLPDEPVLLWVAYSDASRSHITLDPGETLPPDECCIVWLRKKPTNEANTQPSAASEP